MGLFSQTQDREEDATYVAAKEAAASKKKARKDAYSYPELLPPAEDPTTQGARKIGRVREHRQLTTMLYPAVPAVPVHSILTGHVSV